MFLLTEEKVQAWSIKEFFAKFTFYMDKIMFANVDPFIREKKRQFLLMQDRNKLSKFANVFNRLNEDTKQRIIG